MPPVVAAAVIGGAAVMGASAMTASSAEDTNEKAAEEAQKNREFQQDNSDTAHQREVRDLRLAGLNPILSANGGASTPSGAMATFRNPMENVPSDVSNASRGITDSISAATSIDVAKNQVKISSANAKAADAEAEVARGSVDAKIAEAKAKATSAAVASAKAITEKEFNQSRTGRAGIKFNQFIRNLFGRNN